MRALEFCFGVLSFVALTTLSNSDVQAQAASCAPRHFYNHSNLVWTITMPTGATCSLGTAAPQSNCSIAPGDTGILYYNSSSVGGSVLVQSPVFFGSYPVSGCSYLSHHGSTGNVVLNTPAYGDMETCGTSTQPCAAPQPSDCPTRHFQNNSTLTWAVVMSGGGTCTQGSQPTQTRCAVSPGEKLNLNYPNSAAGGAITLQSGDFLQTFQVNQCYLVHQSTTGNVVLNEPDSGDVQTCGQPGNACSVRK